MSKTGRSHRTYCRRCRASVLAHKARIYVFTEGIGWRISTGLCGDCYPIVMRHIENRRLVRP